jgi:2-hydroxymuconate-semialdehyde hydrolase
MAGDIRTNVHDQGEGSPVVLLHGSGPGVSAWANWQRTIPALGKAFRVIAFDIVGFGFTERPETITYDLETWRRHLEAVVDTLGLGQVAIVGNSFGGALALAYAIAHPDRVTRLVLMGSVGVRFPLTEALDRVWGYEPSPESMRRLLELFVVDPSRISDDLVAMRYRATLRPGVQDAYRRMFPAPRQRSIDALASPEDALRRLPHPTLLLHGGEDQVVPPTTSHRLFALLGSAELHLFGGCGHWIQFERPEAFNRLLLEFLTRPAGAAERG